MSCDLKKKKKSKNPHTHKRASENEQVCEWLMVIIALEKSRAGERDLSSSGRNRNLRLRVQ